ncbi:MAG: hypothetical protein IIX08_01575 [Bacteroidales bacterium]|nr:hypothetical protein [Bacteroidales bacterium]
MKNLLKLLVVTALCAFSCVFTGCQEKLKGNEFSLSVKEAGADFITLAVTASKPMEIAYKVTTKAQLVTPAVLFKTGEVIEVADGDVIELREGIQQDTHYYIYAVARFDETTYSERISLEATTTKYEFNELITIVETYLDGYKAHITVPQETKDRNHAIRAGSMPLSWYYLMTSSKGQTTVDVQAIASNGNPYEGHMFTDSTIVLNDKNVILLDEKGNPVLDENNEQIDIHDPIVPGEPTILIAGETYYGTPEEFNYVVGYTAPTMDSWSVPYFDPEKREWLGAFQKKEFFTKEPSLCDATVEIDIPEDEITVTDAMIYFEMSDDAYSYFYIVLDNSTYNQILSTYLNGNEDWYRWFLTSYIGFYEWGIFPETENIAVNAASSFVEPLTGGETYHVLVTVFGDEDGATQRFIHKTFKAKDKTKVAPVIDVTAIESSDPYSVTFNIKAGADSKGNVQPIMGAYWVCNYARDFELMFNADYTYATLLKNMGWTFSSEEIAQVNSPEGLTVTFPTLDGEVTRFAAYGCNDEYTFNVIDEEHTAGWADCKSPLAESVAPVSSELFTLLEGDWTASAKLRAMQQEPDGSILTYHVDHKSKINISASAPELPATLDESVYGLYAGTPEKPGKSKEDVDNMFEELKELSDLFTESRLVGQNRLLCSGFMDFDPAAPQLGVNRLEFRSPYDLFVATDYSSVDVSQLIYDFGPKWFLQIQEDGSVIVPFHSMMLPPMSNWPGYAFYTGGVADGMAFYDSNESYPGFPVEISDDLNTITIKPIVLNDGATDYYYYMNAIGVSQQGGLEIISTVITDIVLKRGWTETAAASSKVACSASANSVTAINMDGSYVNELPKAVVCKSMTEFKAQELPSYTRKEKANVVTKEMVDETSAKILRKYNLQ